MRWFSLLICLILPSPMWAQYGSVSDQDKDREPSSITTGTLATVESSEHELMRLIDSRVAEYVSQMEMQGADSSTSSSTSPVVSRGRSAFSSSCLSCHDANRSLQKLKSYAGWLATVRRMASKDDANIASADIVPIAQYLTSIRGADANSGGDATSGPTLSATISTLFRSGADDHELEKPGFFADAWFGADWQGASPLSATVTACTSCHSDRNRSAGFTLEVVEATAKLDLTRMCCGESNARCCGMDLSAQLKARAVHCSVWRFCIDESSWHLSHSDESSDVQHGPAS